MPWTMGSALKHTRKASTPSKQRQWAGVANSVLRASGDEGKAVRVANAAVKKSQKSKRKQK